MLDLHTLEIFVAAAETGSFSRAAVRLGVAQPTVSRVIKGFEEMWGEPVFYRTGRGVQLSEFGEVAYRRSRELLAQVEQAMIDLRETNRRPIGEVTIGVPPSLVGSVVPELARRLRDEEPGIKLRVREGFSDQIERWLIDGSAEIGLVSKYREADQRIDGELFCSPLMLARLRSDEPAPATIEFAELEGKPLVLPIVPNGLRMAVEAVARRLRFTLNVFVDAESILAQKTIAKECDCYMIKALHSLDKVADKHFATSLIVNPQIMRSIGISTTQARPLSKATREVAIRIEAVVRSLSH